MMYTDVYEMVTFQTTRTTCVNACARSGDDPQTLGARVARFLVSPYSLDATLEFLRTFIGTSWSSIQPVYDKVLVGGLWRPWTSSIAAGAPVVPHRRRCYVVDLATQTVVVYGPEYRQEGKFWLYDTATMTYTELAAFFGVPLPAAAARVHVPIVRTFNPSTKYRRVDVAGCVAFRTTNGLRFDAYSWRDGGRRRFGVCVAKLLVGPQTLDAAMQFVGRDTCPTYEITYVNRTRTAIVPDRHACYDVDLLTKTVVVTPELQDGDETLTLTFEEFATWTDV